MTVFVDEDTDVASPLAPPPKDDGTGAGRGDDLAS